jgi:hypothetical protein
MISRSGRKGAATQGKTSLRSLHRSDRCVNLFGDELFKENGYALCIAVEVLMNPTIISSFYNSFFWLLLSPDPCRASDHGSLFSFQPWKWRYRSSPH